MIEIDVMNGRSVNTLMALWSNVPVVLLLRVLAGIVVSALCISAAGYHSRLLGVAAAGGRRVAVAVVRIGCRWRSGDVALGVLIDGRR